MKYNIGDRFMGKSETIIIGWYHYIVNDSIFEIIDKTETQYKIKCYDTNVSIWIYCDDLDEKFKQVITSGSHIRGHRARLSVCDDFKPFDSIDWNFLNEFKINGYEEKFKQEYNAKWIGGENMNKQEKKLKSEVRMDKISKEVRELKEKLEQLNTEINAETSRVKSKVVGKVKVVNGKFYVMRDNKPYTSKKFVKKLKALNRLQSKRVEIETRLKELYKLDDVELILNKIDVDEIISVNSDKASVSVVNFKESMLFSTETNKVVSKVTDGDEFDPVKGFLLNFFKNEAKLEQSEISLLFEYISSNVKG